MTRARLSDRMAALTVDEVRGWEEDPYFAGFGRRRLETATVGPLTLERATSAEGEQTIRAALTADVQRVARASIEAGGGVRGLCLARHVPAHVLVRPTDTIREIMEQCGR